MINASRTFLAAGLALTLMSCQDGRETQLPTQPTQSDNRMPSNGFEFIARVDPQAGRIDIDPIVDSSGHGLMAANVVQNGTANVGPTNSVELVTSPDPTSDATGTGACAPFTSSFCGNVFVRNFYLGPLRDVYVELTNVNPASTHPSLNSAAPTQNVTNTYGLWSYGGLHAAPSAGQAGQAIGRLWVFADDGTPFTIRGRVMANLCSDAVQDGDEEDVDCGGTECPACGTCTDGTQNNGETGVDCGGPCATACNLVINEVDYDQPIAGDPAEFVEIYNGTAAAADLSSLAVVLVDGDTRTEYRRVALSGTLAAGDYLVVCDQGATAGTCNDAIGVAPGVAIFNFDVTNAAIQNGDNQAADGVALINTGTGELIDALSYEGATSGTINGMSYNLVEGSNPTFAADEEDNNFELSLQRAPNGRDSNVAFTDWIQAAPTPGLGNF